MRFMSLLMLCVGTAAFAMTPKETNRSSSNSAEEKPVDWSGPYLGINGGGGWGTTKWNFAQKGGGDSKPDLFANYVDGGSFKQSPSAGALGGHLGFNKQWCSFVFGLEGAFEGSWIKQKSTDPLVISAVPTPTTTYTSSVLWFATMTPRLGYALNHWLFYTKGGLSAGHVKSSLHSTRTQDGEQLHFKQKQDHIGWTVGAGVEYLLQQHWIFGVEYDYTQLSKRNYGGKVVPNTTWPLAYTMQPSFNLFLARISYKI